VRLCNVMMEWGWLEVHAFVSVFAELCKVMVGERGLRLMCSCFREGFYSAGKGFLAWSRRIDCR
jgi:hypothetical protein